MARLPYVDPASASPEVQDILARLPVSLNVFRMMANAETAFRPLIQLGTAILGRLDLNPALREMLDPAGRPALAGAVRVDAARAHCARGRRVRRRRSRRWSAASSTRPASTRASARHSPPPSSCSNGLACRMRGSRRSPRTSSPADRRAPRDRRLLHAGRAPARVDGRRAGPAGGHGRRGRRKTVSPRSRFVVANRLRHHLLEWGDDGPVVLLLHGFLEHAHTWDLVAPRLAAARLSRLRARLARPRRLRVGRRGRLLPLRRLRRRSGLRGPRARRIASRSSRTRWARRRRCSTPAPSPTA